jgi:hypothetical protein
MLSIAVMLPMASAPPVGSAAPVSTAARKARLIVVGGAAGDGVLAEGPADLLAERVAGVRQAGVVELDGAVLGLDAEEPAKGAILNVGEEGSRDTTREAEIGLDAGVRAKLAQPRGRGDDLGLGTHKAAEPVQRIAAEVHHRAAALHRVVADVFRIPRDVDAKLGAECSDSAAPRLQ